jgi:hypothetical protein
MEEAETLTEQGDVPGTLAYISPERLAGQPATAAADVWAVGVMLWEALSGRHPFWQSSMIETARAIEAGAPALSTLRPDLPNALLALVDRSLSLAPGRRPTARSSRPSYAARPHRGRSSAPHRRLRGPGEARVGAAVLAALFAYWTASALPFFPQAGRSAWPRRRGAHRFPRAARACRRARRAGPAAREHLLSGSRSSTGRSRRLARPDLAGAAHRPSLRGRRRAPPLARSGSCRSSSRVALPRHGAPPRAPLPCFAATLAAGLRGVPCR